MTTYYGVGDAIEGKRITCEFRKTKKKTSLISGTARHRRQRTTLDDAFCAIMKPLKRA
jgi:hypothetical protein